GDMLRVTGMSFSPAAPMGPGTIRMHEPYLDPFGRPTRGIDFLSLDKQEAFIEFCATNEVRANFVVSGDRDLDEVIDGLEAAEKAHEIRGRRWVIQHAIIINERQAQKL